MAEGEFGIVANVRDPDHVLRLGAKVWIVGGTGGEGWHRFVVRGLAKSGHPIEKWCPTKRLHNFRAAWIPPKIRTENPHIYMQGEKAEMVERAELMEAFASELREKAAA
jgi:hypothetical protein